MHKLEKVIRYIEDIVDKIEIDWKLTIIVNILLIPFFMIYFLF